MPTEAPPRPAPAQPRIASLRFGRRSTLRVEEKKVKRYTIAEWSDELALGIPEIDGQHKELLKIINELWSAIVANRNEDVLDGVLGELESYTRAHFTAEEVLMRVEKYPRFETHKQLHHAFIDKIAATRAEVSKGKQIELDLLHYLTDWLVKHILGADRDYATFVTQQQRQGDFFGRFFPFLQRRAKKAA
jgi:hemerythrin-like metal-binding protein